MKTEYWRSQLAAESHDPFHRPTLWNSLQETGLSLNTCGSNWKLVFRHRWTIWHCSGVLRFWHCYKCYELLI